MPRPTYKELDKKLSEAIKAADHKHVNLINPHALAADAVELGYRIEDQFIDSLTSVLQNTTPDDYAGRRPPARSYENIILANELYSFRTQSDVFKCIIYLKFTLFENELWVVSFHKNRNKKTGSKR